MKIKFLLLSFLTVLFACNKSDSNVNPNSKNVDYEFTITINGLTHKIKGNTINGAPFGNVGSVGGQTNNKCQASVASKGLFLEINDVSEFNYVSGKVLKCTLLLPNLSLGVNNANLQFDLTPGGYWSNLTDSLGAYAVFGFTTTRGGSYGSGYNIPINITDLGVAPTLNNIPTNWWNHTKTLKGNFNGTLYMQNKSNLVYDVPINISIDFKAVRIN